MPGVWGAAGSSGLVGGGGAAATGAATGAAAATVAGAVGIDHDADDVGGDVAGFEGLEAGDGGVEVGGGGGLDLGDDDGVVEAGGGEADDVVVGHFGGLGGGGGPVGGVGLCGQAGDGGEEDEGRAEVHRGTHWCSLDRVGNGVVQGCSGWWRKDSTEVREGRGEPGGEGDYGGERGVPPPPVLRG